MPSSTATRSPLRVAVSDLRLAVDLFIESRAKIIETIGFLAEDDDSNAGSVSSLVYQAAVTREAEQLTHQTTEEGGGRFDVIGSISIDELTDFVRMCEMFLDEESKAVSADA